MKKSKSIRWQITGAFLGFLVLALGLIIFLNMTFMEQYYLENKKEILKTSYETIAKEYDAVDKSRIIVQFHSRFAHNVDTPHA